MDAPHDRRTLWTTRRSPSGFTLIAFRWRSDAPEHVEWKVSTSKEMTHSISVVDKDGKLLLPFGYASLEQIANAVMDNLATDPSWGSVMSLTGCA